MGIRRIKIEQVNASICGKFFNERIVLHSRMEPHVSGVQMDLSIGKLNKHNGCARTMVGVAKCDRRLPSTCSTSSAIFIVSTLIFVNPALIVRVLHDELWRYTMNRPKQGCRHRGAVDPCWAGVGTIPGQSAVVITVIMSQDEGAGGIRGLPAEGLEGIDVETGASVHRVASLGLVHRHVLQREAIFKEQMLQCVLSGFIFYFLFLFCSLQLATCNLQPHGTSLIDGKDTGRPVRSVVTSLPFIYTHFILSFWFLV